MVAAMAHSTCTATCMSTRDMCSRVRIMQHSSSIARVLKGRFRSIATTRFRLPRAPFSTRRLSSPKDSTAPVSPLACLRLIRRAPVCRPRLCLHESMLLLPLIRLDFAFCRRPHHQRLDSSPRTCRLNLPTSSR